MSQAKSGQSESKFFRINGVNGAASLQLQSFINWSGSKTGGKTSAGDILFGGH